MISNGAAKDEILFAEEGEDAGETLEPWAVLVVDDEDDVHAMTALLLSSAVFLDRPLELISAYSAAEARTILAARADIAVVLLDVVMEEDHAGLKLTRWIREDLANHDVRIILRTGQPGEAPRREVIIRYEIDDYRSKTELSADALFTAVVSALRSYNHIMSIETKVAERTRELLESREQLSVILESSPVGVVAFDRMGHVVFVNDRLGALIGIGKDFLLGLTAANLFEAHDGQRDLVAHLLDHRRIRDAEIKVRRADGTTIWVLVSGDPATIEGRPAYLAWIHDISRRKLTERQLQVSKEEAERATAAKSAFLATMSHEIRTPMNGVLGMLEMLECSPLDASQTDTVATIRESATGLLSIIDDILDFSKIEAGRMDLEKLPMCFASLVEVVAETLAPSARRKGLELLAYVDPAIPTNLLGDPVRLRQILFNLTGNAIKFTERGRVIIHVEPRPIREGRITLRLEVRDTGVGIAAEVIPLLFQPFTQAESSTTRRFGGTGLGLSICRRLAELMEGRIGVESVQGAGSVFWLDLPFTAAKTEGATKTGSAAKTGGAAPALADLDLAKIDLDGVTVLAGVPSEPERGFLTLYLEAAGARVVPASNVEALSMGDQTANRDGPEIDVMLLDAAMCGQAMEKRTGGLPRRPDGRTRPIVLLCEPSADGGRVPIQPSREITSLSRPIRRSALLRAVAVAAGRVPPEDEAPDARPAGGASVGGGRAGAAARPANQIHLATTEEATAQGRLILVAEDNAVNRKVMRMQLNTLGYTAEMTANGVEALEASASGRHAILLTDLHMPEMDGYELTARIRQREREGHGDGRRLPIVAITANSPPLEANRFQSSDMDGWLSKPLDMTRLGELLARWLPPLPPAPAAEAAIDPAVLRALTGGDEEMALELLGDFIAVSRGIHADLVAALAARDLSRVRGCAHNLKGSARTAGARPLAQAAAELEQASAARAGWEALRGLAAALDAALAAVEDQVGGAP